MKARMSIRSIIMVMAIIGLLSMFFLNICFAANTGKIKTETARLREQPQTDSKVLDLASIGDEVEILEEVDGWYKVKYKNITGYIRADLVEVKNKEENVASNVETNTSETEETLIGTKKVIFADTKLKIIPLINAIEIGEVKQNEEVEITEVLNDWAKIKTTDGKEGWVVRRRTASTGEIIPAFVLTQNKDNTTQNETTTESEINNNTSNNTSNGNETSNNQTENTTKTMYVNSKTVNLRQKADKTSQVIKQVSVNTQVTVISTENGWAYIDINGTKGYIAENLLSTTKQETSRGTMTQRNTTTNTNKQETQKAENTISKTNTANTKVVSSPSTSDSTSSKTGSSVVSYAKQFLGSKYVYGGTTTSGFDCSGFTRFVYKHFGVSLNRTAAAQYSNGTAVTSLQAGDLVMFGKSGINHVGIYIGGNTFIHAENPSKGVTTTSLSSSYYKNNYVGARRIF